MFLLHEKVCDGSTEKLSDDLLQRLDEISNTPYALDDGFFYIYKDVVEKAAKLACEIADKRPFQNGNHATAMLALLTLLDVNGIVLRVQPDDLKQLKLLIDEMQFEQCCAWIRNHVEARRWNEE